MVILPSPDVAIAAAVAAALSLLGVVLSVSAVVAAGASLAWIEYVIALSRSTAGLDVVSALASGTVSFLLVQTVDFAGRFRAIPLPRAAFVSQVSRYVAQLLSSSVNRRAGRSIGNA
jgi:hypothetical protein